MSEKRVVRRSVTIALGIICIILIAGLGGVIVTYTVVISNRDSQIASIYSQIADQNHTISSLYSQISQLNSNVTNLQNQVAISARGRIK